MPSFRILNFLFCHPDHPCFANTCILFQYCQLGCLQDRPLSQEGQAYFLVNEVYRDVQELKFFHGPSPF